MICCPDLKIDRKMILAAAVAVFVFAGIILFATRSNKPLINADQPSEQAAAPEQKINPVQLAEEYQIKSAKISDDFFAAYQAGGDVAAAAKSAQQALLNLSLPAEFKQKHLLEVLKLGEIAELSQAGKTAGLAEKVSELKALISQ